VELSIGAAHFLNLPVVVVRGAGRDQKRLAIAGSLWDGVQSSMQDGGDVIGVVEDGSLSS
jgi:hypothetical protein